MQKKVLKKKTRGERKKKGKKKKSKHENIKIGKEGEREGEREEEKEKEWVGVAKVSGNNSAVPSEKERWGGGYLDNRTGDRSTMAAVFSIRHYLIDRVAGLIV